VLEHLLFYDIWFGSRTAGANESSVDDVARPGPEAKFYDGKILTEGDSQQGLQAVYFIHPIPILF